MMALEDQESKMKLALRGVQDAARSYLSEVVLYRVRVGRSLVEHLFQGDFSAVHDRDPRRASSLAAFWRLHGMTLQELGLNLPMLRRSIHAAEVADGVAEETLRKLTVSHLTALATVKEPAWRQALLEQAAEQAWTERELRRMITAADAGEPVADVDPDRPGVQPLLGEADDSPPPPPAGPVRPVAVTRQMRATVGVLKALNATLSRRAASRWTAGQAEEAWEMVDRLEAELATAKTRLPKRGS